MPRRRMIQLLIALVALLALALSACGGSVTGPEPGAAGTPTIESPPTEPAEEPTTAAPTPTAELETAGETARPIPTEEEAMEVPGSAAALVEQAKSDLSGRLDVAEAEIEVLSVEEVTWPDGSLGCPQPGMMYTQALVDGSRIRLQVDGEIYAYHSGGNRPPFLCKQETATILPQDGPREVPKMTPGAGGMSLSGENALVNMAKVDLAQRLNVEEAEVELVRFEPVVWPDAGLGCPQPGMAYTQVQVDGAFIQLRAGGQTYNYHTGGNRTPFLCDSPDEMLPEDLSAPGAGGGDT